MKIYAGFRFQTHYRSTFFGRKGLRLIILRLVLISERGRVFDFVLTRHNEDKVNSEMFDFITAESKGEPITIFCAEHYDTFLFQGLMTHATGKDLEVQYMVMDQSLTEYMELLDEVDFDEEYSFKAYRINEDMPFTSQQKVDMFKSHSDYPATHEEADLQDRVLYLKESEQFLSRHRSNQINIIKFMIPDEDDNSEK